MLNALQGGIRQLFGDVFSGIYTEAKLVKFARTESLGGDISQDEEEYDCFHHPVNGNERYRREAGLADKELEVIVLALHLGETTINTDDEIRSGTATYSVVRAKLDGAKSQWRCVCKEKA